MRARTTVNAVVTACVALVACACGPEPTKEDAGAKASQSATSKSASASAQAEEPSATPSASARTEKPSATSTGEQPSPRTKEGAIRRYEQYLHALGHEDIDTVCDVAGPAAKQAEDQGLGPCTSTYTAVFQMISPAQKKALQTATVDPRRVVVRTPGTIEMPVEAVRSSATFSESDLGSYTLEYVRKDWYITD
ncbi:hypothetical protein ABZY16_01380 [Streptomyces sp. NPDC006553]|uniref:hypothetical protein n=1 Tax=unclassified Streptomyces TaxID=2593676 RepID=UPI0022575F6B|nr:hypothetical protein [Streptomyces sp. NBC_00233]MCX5232392.1 hypothetical protein [Streptomyces sp. NBC_00233]